MIHNACAGSRGLQGSSNWAVAGPHTISAKLTKASSGIVFATIGMILGIVVVLQKAVSFQTGVDSTFIRRKRLAK